jgi:hypothetical protein
MAATKVAVGGGGVPKQATSSQYFKVKNKQFMATETIKCSIVILILFERCRTEVGFLMTC